MTDSEHAPEVKGKGFIFAIAMWFLSRLVIVVAMQLIAPSMSMTPAHHDLPLPIGFVPGYVPKAGWELFSHWDGGWYRKIATLGYDYAIDGQQHSIAFFPLFPLMTRVVMALGLPFDVAATLVNSLAFLGALIFLYRWVEERHGTHAARWATAVLAWFPYSIYGTVIYTEGLFLLTTTAALRAFDKGQYLWAALWGAMATATRVPGAALVPTFLLVAWRERRPPIAYATAIATTGGLLLFSIYCALTFKDPLAFVHVQQTWGASSWLNLLSGVLALNGGAVVKVGMMFGGCYLLWYVRAELNRVAFTYGLCYFALILGSGSVMSLNRFAYALVSLSIALGILLARHPRWGYAIVGLFAVSLIRAAINFSWWRWVA